MNEFKLVMAEYLLVYKLCLFFYNVSIFMDCSS